MDIEQLRAAKHEMEDSIRTAAEKAMDEFYVATGMSPESIQINLIQEIIIGKRVQRSYVESVEAEIKV